MEPSILSIVPIILTIGLAVWSRNVILSLFVGVLSGVLIIHGGHPIESIQSMFSDYVLANMMDSYNAGICLLLVFIGGFVTLIEKSGGAEAFARSVAKFVNTRHKFNYSVADSQTHNPIDDRKSSLCNGDRLVGNWYYGSGDNELKLLHFQFKSNKEWQWKCENRRRVSMKDSIGYNKFRKNIVEKMK